MAAQSHRSVLVLYGSETGNAQDAAEELAKVCRRLHFITRVKELNAIDLDALLQYRLVIFAISTTGQGDLPHNALLFWRKLLRKRLPPGRLTQLSFTCFGLGDSTYLKFNWAARKLIRRLEQLGARTFFEACEADEQHPEGIDGSFLRWSDALKKHLSQHYPLPFGLQPIPDDADLPTRWDLGPALQGPCTALSHPSRAPQTLVNGCTQSSTPHLPPPDLLPTPDCWTATIADSKRLTPETHWQDVRLISFQLPFRDPDEKLLCNPGDCLTISPKNFPDDVQKLIALMNWGSIADRPLDLALCASLPDNLRAPAPCTIRHLLLYDIDIMAVPRRSFLKSIAFFSSDPDHRERLLEFTTPEFLDDYLDYATRSRRTIMEVLEDFPSVRIPAKRLLDVFPLLRGRDFSIANGGDQLTHTSRGDAVNVELLVAMVKYRTILRKPRQGVCSRYLAHLPLDASLTVRLKTGLSPIHGETNAQRPLIAMATGTGIAPIRALIHQRLTYARRGPMLLFFGCRNRTADFFFQDEWDALRQEVLLFTAFSRDQRDKIYVQDLVRREASRLAALLPDRPIFVVCGGSSKMAVACKDAVSEPFLAVGDEAVQRKMLDAATWWQEIW